MSQPQEQFSNPGHFYAEEVLSGRVPANDLVKRACQRYLDDWNHAAEKGLEFREEYAWHAIEYMEDLHHTKGKLAGQKFIQLPWQRFCTWNLFGWYMRYTPDPSDVDPPEYVRRFRTALVMVQKKNGKTAWMAAIGIYLTDGDGENLAEVYSAATTRDQAKLVWNDAGEMARRHPALRRKSRKNLSEIKFDHGGIFKPLASKADSADGKNPNGALLDELHLHPDGSLYDVLEHSMAREQPMLIAISTAGDDTSSFCYEERCRAERILLRQEQDERHFVYICEPDQGDNWTDEEVWRKVNPSLGSSFSMEDLRTVYTKSQSTPRARAKFKQYRLGFWPGSEHTFLDMEEWRACGADFTEADFEGMECTGGVDLASTRDFNALVLTFERDGEYFGLPYFWVPELTAKRRSREDRIPYMAWAEMGLIKLIPGATTDPEVIADFVKDELMTRFRITRMDYDPWQSTELVKLLDDLGLVMVECRQGYGTMNAPTKKLERLIYSHKYHHPKHIVFDWMFGNLVVTSGPADALKPDKIKSREKIDGPVAQIMSIRGQLAGTESKESAYDAEMRELARRREAGEETSKFGLL